MKRIKFVIVSMVALAMVSLSACTDVANTSEDANILAEIDTEYMQVYLVQTAEEKAKVVVTCDGENKVDVYNVRNIDTRDESSFVQGNDLGKNTLLLSYYSYPTEVYDNDRSKMFVLFEITDGGLTPIALGRDTFFEIDCDDDGVIEVITNYGVMWRESEILVYDVNDGIVVCADPEESVKDLYGFVSYGVHLPYEFIKDHEGDLCFESNRYLGAKVAFSDLIFREMPWEKLVNLVINESRDGHIEENPNPQRPISLSGNETIKGTYFICESVECYNHGGYDNRIELALPYEIKLSKDGKIEAVTLQEMEWVWGSRSWSRVDKSNGPVISTVLLDEPFAEEWEVTISNDGLRAIIEGSFDVEIGYYSLAGYKLRTNKETHFRQTELLLPGAPLFE